MMPRFRSHGDVWLLTVGLCVFAALAHTSGLLLIGGLAGLLLAGIVLTRRGFAVADRAALFSPVLAGRIWPLGVLLAVVTGVFLGILDRGSLGRTLLPKTLLPFALVAASIGAAEEVVYRGFVFGRLRGQGEGIAIVVAAGSHTFYKVCLYLLPPSGIHGDLRALALWTFAGGLWFGIMRARLGGLLIPAIAHALFDVVVYGDFVSAPWWVY